MENTTLIQPETEKKFLTQDELSQIKKLNEDNQELVIKFGQVEYQLQNLNMQKDTLIDDLETNKATEVKLLSRIKAKYGEVSINLETGEVTQ